MMLFQVPVLPSNAPPLNDPDGQAARSSRVLREHSGNRQYRDNPHSEDSSHKPRFTLNENSYAANLALTSECAAGSLERPIWGYTHFKPRHVKADPWNEENRLYDRFTRSDGWNKYRERQKANQQGGQEQKWPVKLEIAFFRALVRHPPMGRKKEMHKGKARGRNELISDFIYEATGVHRDRKQISSHIQVLKSFVMNDPEIMRYLSKPDRNGARGRLYDDSSTATYSSGKRLSRYPGAPSSSASHQPKAPCLDRAALSHVWNHLGIFRPTEFEMFVQRKFASGSTERLHTYTSADANALSQTDIAHHDWQSFCDAYPLLAAMHLKQPLQCNVLVAEAHIALSSTERWKDEQGNNLPDVELGILFLCQSLHLPANTKLSCKNSFYRNGGYVADESGYPFVTNLSLAQDGTSVETQLKFGSNFWARHLHHLAARFSEASSVSLHNASDDAVAFLQNITVYQEVRVATTHGLERLIVIQWNFHFSDTLHNRTTWSRLKIPPVSSLTVSPATPGVASSANSSFNDSNRSCTNSCTETIMPPTSQPTLRSPFKYETPNPTGLWPVENLALESKPCVTAPSFDCPVARSDGETSHVISHQEGLDLDLLYESGFDFDRFNDLALMTTADGSSAVRCDSNDDGSWRHHGDTTFLAHPGIGAGIDMQWDAYAPNLFTQPCHSYGHNNDDGTPAFLDSHHRRPPDHIVKGYAHDLVPEPNRAFATGHGAAATEAVDAEICDHTGTQDHDGVRDYIGLHGPPESHHDPTHGFPAIHVHNQDPNLSVLAMPDEDDDTDDDSSEDHDSDANDDTIKAELSADDYADVDEEHGGWYPNFDDTAGFVMVDGTLAHVNARRNAENKHQQRNHHFEPHNPGHPTDHRDRGRGLATRSRLNCNEDRLKEENRDGLVMEIQAYEGAGQEGGGSKSLEALTEVEFLTGSGSGSSGH